MVGGRRVRITQRGQHMKRTILALLGLAVIAGFTVLPRVARADDGDDSEGRRRDWPQWGQNAQHQGIIDVVAQALNKQRADLVYDPFVPLEQQDNDGDLLAHYQAPLVVGNTVY